MLNYYFPECLIPLSMIFFNKMLFYCRVKKIMAKNLASSSFMQKYEKYRDFSQRMKQETGMGHPFQLLLLFFNVHAAVSNLKVHSATSFKKNVPRKKCGTFFMLYKSSLMGFHNNFIIKLDYKTHLAVKSKTYWPSILLFWKCK